MIANNRFFQFLALFCAALLISGCSSTKKMLDLDTTAVLDIRIAEEVNPNEDGRSTPVVIRVFSLADERQFKREDFLNLYEDAANRLGKDLIDEVKLRELAPSEQRIEKLELTEDTRFLGIMAEFSQFQNAQALIVLPIEAHSKNKYTLIAKGLSIGIKE